MTPIPRESDVPNLLFQIRAAEIRGTPLQLSGTQREERTEYSEWVH